MGVERSFICQGLLQGENTILRVVTHSECVKVFLPRQTVKKVMDLYLKSECPREWGLLDASSA